MTIGEIIDIIQEISQLEHNLVKLNFMAEHAPHLKIKIKEIHARIEYLLGLKSDEKI